MKIGHLESFYRWLSERQLYVTVPFFFSHWQRDDNGQQLIKPNHLSKEACTVIAETPKLLSVVLRQRFSFCLWFFVE